MWFPEASSLGQQGCAKALGQHGVGWFGEEQEQGACSGETEGRHGAGGGGDIAGAEP